MSRSLGNIIADSMDRSISYADQLLGGVTAERFARFATPGGEMITSNHPAFIYGHLSLYSAKIHKDLGLEAPEVPENFKAVFSKDAVCEDDSEGKIYPVMGSVIDFFFDSYRLTSTALRNADNAAFDKPNPMGGRLLEIFPTIGSMHAFYGSGHMMIHLGQMSAWRRMEGLGAAG